MSEQWDIEDGTLYETSPNTNPAVMEAADAAVAAPREGLPREYRMRADRHYVDQLASTSPAQPLRMIPLAQIDCSVRGFGGDLRPLIESIRAQGIVRPVIVRRQGSRFAVVAGRKRLVAAEQLRLGTIPCLIHDGTEGDAATLQTADNLFVREQAPRREPIDLATVHGLVAAHLDGIRGCAGGAVTGGLDGPAQVLVKAHAWRAAQLLAIVNLMLETPCAPGRERPLASVIDEIVDGFEPEASLNGVAIQTELMPGISSAGLPEAQLKAGLAGAVLATLPLVAHADRPVIVIKASKADDALLVLEVLQRDAAVPRRLVRDFFDDDAATDRAGGYAAGLGALAVRAFAERHGGTAAFEPLDPGSRLVTRLVRRPPIAGQRAGKAAEE